MTEVWPFVLQQVIHQAPTLLVLLLGGIMAIAGLNRFRAAAWLCLIGCGVSILTILLLTGFQGWLLGARMKEGWSLVRYGQAMTILGLAGAVLRAVGFGLILAAVFVGRSPSQPSGAA